MVFQSESLSWLELRGERPGRGRDIFISLLTGSNMRQPMRLSYVCTHTRHHLIMIGTTSNAIDIGTPDTRPPELSEV